MSGCLPLPEADSLTVSNDLQKKLHRRIAQHDGCLPFEIFMEMALYEPGLGYYSNGLMPFGEQGDFVTAPESGDLFGRCLARCVASVLCQLENRSVLELGAGSGALAPVVLQELQALDALPERYYILERSGAMRKLQQQALQEIPDLAALVEWLDELPEQALNGVVFGNEVADALPVSRFLWRDGQVTAVGVAAANEGLSLCERAADQALSRAVKMLASSNAWQGDYHSEYCPSLAAWVKTLCACIDRGALLLVDYGYGRREYYHPQRTMGTLMCHYRHQAHTDTLWYPGLQDITAFVDFTTIAEAASDAGLRLEGYDSQAQFLLACGLEQLLAEADPADARRFLLLSNEAKRLLLPGEMGERFKCIGFSRGLSEPMRGFALPDLRSRL
jgi:SAM-dependent MidA family methyltransferase